ncbi:hypothetical protein, partial [Streptomyces violaceus]|uniref:hypothetical protein n=1 Tax=Streptomyces violaceus TaxID=1936 RepID=UPI0031E905FE
MVDTRASAGGQVRGSGRVQGQQPGIDARGVEVALDRGAGVRQALQDPGVALVRDLGAHLQRASCALVQVGGHPGPPHLVGVPGLPRAQLPGGSAQRPQIVGPHRADLLTARLQMPQAVSSAPRMTGPQVP